MSLASSSNNPSLLFKLQEAAHDRSEAYAVIACNINRCNKNGLLSSHRPPIPVSDLQAIRAVGEWPRGEPNRTGAANLLTENQRLEADECTHHKVGEAHASERPTVKQIGVTIISGDGAELLIVD